MREEVCEAPADALLLRREDLEAIAARPRARSHRELYLRREREWRRDSRLRPPDALGAAAAAAPPAPAAAGGETGEALSGTGFAGGVVTGRARPVSNLYDPDLLDDLGGDDILVLPAALAFVYADWHSLLTVVRGVLSPGRPSQHLVQVARECGVPLVGHVTGDLGAIPAGARLRIDGRTGGVALLTESAG